jgi:hypothetical protein
MELSGENWFWRGSARWHFLAEGPELGDIVTARLTIGA